MRVERKPLIRKPLVTGFIAPCVDDSKPTLPSMTLVPTRTHVPAEPLR